MHNGSGDRAWTITPKSANRGAGGNLDSEGTTGLKAVLDDAVQGRGATHHHRDEVFGFEAEIERQRVGADTAAFRNRS